MRACDMHACTAVCVCVCACVRACVRAGGRACVRGSASVCVHVSDALSCAVCVTVRVCVCGRASVIALALCVHAYGYTCVCAHMRGHVRLKGGPVAPVYQNFCRTAI